MKQNQQKILFLIHIYLSTTLAIILFLVGLYTFISLIYGNNILNI